MAEKHTITDKSDTETDTGGEASISQSHSRYNKGHVTNTYLEEATVDFVKDPEELYDNTNDHVKDKARKECLSTHLQSFNQHGQHGDHSMQSTDTHYSLNKSPTSGHSSVNQ